jgi:hypothetical protein
MTSEWRDYIHAVYGSLESHDSFPIDLRCFTHWWHGLLPPGKRSLFQRHYRPGGLAAAVRGSLVDYAGSRSTGRGLAWQLYLLDGADVTSVMRGAMGRFDNELVSVPFRDRAVTFEPVALSPSSNLTALWQDERAFTIRAPVPSHAWIEVHHEYSDCEGSKFGLEGKHVGWWAHYAPGSGVWANVGKTLVAGRAGYRAACTATAQRTNRSTAPCDACCTPAHQVLRTSATDLQYDSLQSCCGARGGTGASVMFEIVFFAAACPRQRSLNTSTCPPELNLRRGRTRKFAHEQHHATGHAGVKAHQLAEAMSGSKPADCGYMGEARMK